MIYGSHDNQSVSCYSLTVNMAQPREIILSVVDQSPIRRDGTPTEALNESVGLAVHTEKAGYLSLIHI